MPLPLQLRHTLHLLGVLASWRNGTLVGHRERLFKVRRRERREGPL